VGREEDTVDAGRLGRSKEGADVLGILERVEHEHEGRLAALHGPREDIVDARVDPWLDGEGDALVPVEARERRQGSAFDLDDRDPEAGRVQDEPLERLTALRDDEQPMGRSTCDEGLLDRAPAGDELLVVGQEVGRWDGGPEALIGAGPIRPRSVLRRPARSGSARPEAIRARTIESFSGPLVESFSGRPVESFSGRRARGARPRRVSATVTRPGRAAAERRSRSRLVPTSAAARAAVALLPRRTRSTFGRAVAAGTVAWSLGWEALFALEPAWTARRWTTGPSP
jgi:hypothetical protein